MPKMTLIALAAGLAGLSMAAAYADPPAQAKRPFLFTTLGLFNSMSYPDNRTILFRMNGGTPRVWRNELPRECPGLKFEAGIAWNIWGGEVCSNMQVFYVLRRGTPCMLGTFVPGDMPRQDGWVPPPKR